MELRHLRYFIVAANKRHISEAAAELHMAQPGLSKQLNDLQKELGGGPLFERMYGRKLRLTRAGEVLLTHAQQVLAQVERLQAEMRALQGLDGGRVIIGSPQSVGERRLPNILAAFHQYYPAVEIVIVEGSTRTLVDMLDRESIDLAIVSLPLGRSDLLVKELFKEQLVLVVGREHHLASRKEVRFGELRHEKFLLYAAGGFVREATISACHEAGFRPHIAVDGGSMEMLLRVAEAGLGVAVLPPLAVKAGETRLTTLKLITEKVSLERHMAIATRQNESQATNHLRAFLEASLSQQREYEPAD